ncbi:MAG TPA: hypothetical protein VEI53_03815, partial [Ktedonobacteraceae bacterium]|nr:hypothetical protein [Ktedonobacteraceae bacterium]
MTLPQNVPAVDALHPLQQNSVRRTALHVPQCASGVRREEQFHPHRRLVNLLFVHLQRLHVSWP